MRETHSLSRLWFFWSLPVYPSVTFPFFLIIFDIIKKYPFLYVISIWWTEESLVINEQVVLHFSCQKLKNLILVTIELIPISCFTSTITVVIIFLKFLFTIVNLLLTVFPLDFPHVPTIIRSRVFYSLVLCSRCQLLTIWNL